MNKTEIQKTIAKILDLVNEAHDLCQEIELADNQQLIDLSESIKSALSQSSTQMLDLSKKLNESPAEKQPENTNEESEVEEEIALQDKKIPPIDKKKESKNE